MAKDQPKNSNAVALIALPNESAARAVARCVLDPATTAAGTLNTLHRKVSPEGDINGYIAELQQQVKAANAGTLTRSEAMLVTQAATLDALFHTLSGWALNNAKEGGNPAYFETCMRLAFKAQSQSRATNETLAEIKNPPNVAFVRQANIAAGPQQVNNGVQPSGAGGNKIPPTKLLKAEHGQWMANRAALAPGRANRAVEAVAAVHGAANTRRQGEG